MTTPSPLDQFLAQARKRNTNVTRPIAGINMPTGAVAPNSQANITGNFRGGRPSLISQAIAETQKPQVGSGGGGLAGGLDMGVQKQLQNLGLNRQQIGDLAAGRHGSSFLHQLNEGFNRALAIPANLFNEVADNSAQGQKYHDTHNDSSGFGGLMHALKGDIMDAPGAVADAVTGKKEASGSDVIQHFADTGQAANQGRFGKDVRPGEAYVNPYLKGWGGFAGDAVFNPLNAVGVGTKVVQGAEDAAKPLSEAAITAGHPAKQIALRLGKNKISTGIPALPVGRVLSKAAETKGLAGGFKGMVGRTFLPVASRIGNPALRDLTRRAAGSADQHAFSFKHEVLAPAFGHLSEQGRKDILKTASAGLTHNDPLVNQTSNYISQIGKGISDTIKTEKMPLDLVNSRLSAALKLEPSTTMSFEQQIMQKAAENPMTADKFIGAYHSALEHAIQEHRMYQTLIESGAAKRIPMSPGKKVNPAWKAMQDQGYLKAAHPSLRGYAVHSSIEPQLQRVHDFLHLQHGMSSDNPAIKALDTANRIYKTQAVGYNPASQMRIILGNHYQQVINGHANPLGMRKAFKVLRRHDPAYRDQGESGIVKSLQHLVPDTGQQTGKTMVSRLASGHSLDTNDINNAFEARGLRHTFVHDIRNIDDIAGKTAVGRKLHTINEKLLHFSEGRDTAYRMGTFINALEKAARDNPKKDIQSLYDMAAHEVRKTHLDFTALTPAERKYLTRAIPFYAAISRSTPMAFRQLAERPGRVATLPFAEEEYSKSFKDQPGQGTSLWGDLTPDYLQNNAAVPLGVSNGMPVMLDQKNDVTDALQNFGSGNPLQKTLSNLSPFIKDPAELAMNHNIYTGRAIRNTSDTSGQQAGAVGQYLANQSPFPALANKLMNQSKATTTAPGNDWGGINPNLLRILGLGTTVVTPGAQKANIKTHDDIVKSRLRQQRINNGTSRELP